MPNIMWASDRIEAVLASHRKPYRMVKETDGGWLFPAGALATACACEKELSLALGAEVTVWGVTTEAGMMTLIEVTK